MAGDILIFYFYGDDHFRIDMEVSKLKSSLLNGGNEDFNFDRLYNPSPADFLTIALSYPVFAEKRVLFVEDFDDSLINDESMIEYAKSPPPTTAAVFIQKISRINENTKFLKELKGKNYFKLNKIRLLYENELPAYVRKLASEKGVMLSEETAYYITRYTGNNIHNIDSELDKIAAEAACDRNNAKQVTLDRIKPLISISKKFTVFDFADKFMEKDFRAAFSIFNVIYGDGEEPVKIVSVLYGEIRKLHRGKIQEGSGVDMDSVMSMNSVLPFLRKKFIKNLSAYSEKDLEKIAALLEETDIRLKTTSWPSDLVFEDFIFKASRLQGDVKRKPL